MLCPGGGDPDNFVIEDCSTQRNLNQQGIDQSISMGQEFSKGYTYSTSILLSVVSV